MQAQYEQADEILREFGAAFGPGEQQERPGTDPGLGQAAGTSRRIAAPLSEAAHGMPDEPYTAGGIDVDVQHPEHRDRHRAGCQRGPAGQGRPVQHPRRYGWLAMAALGAMDEKTRSGLTSALMPRGPEQGRLNSLFGRFTCWR